MESGAQFLCSIGFKIFVGVREHTGLG